MFTPLVIWNLSKAQILPVSRDSHFNKEMITNLLHIAGPNEVYANVRVVVHTSSSRLTCFLNDSAFSYSTMHQISGHYSCAGIQGWGRRDIHQAMKGTSKSKQDANFGLLAVPVSINSTTWFPSIDIKSLVPPGILELHCLQNIPQCAGFEACLPLG
ncbi:hypothetical protein PCH_Pc12g09620 [Penicillium rubens Wisconsin 54-1255]|uniref:Uncharacterized protein n=1 Tax=Penicillium rubens (strain ATCC 28089 / DSM 1075 / NRRL 1951 / Wisconsin 54-1255) TaxID=500485 RepID=B6GZR1_PENRW|nr:hypothetical protein PCH_Pc12g09620 [Penicillium rubens Wisconsin 54-1255]